LAIQLKANRCRGPFSDEIAAKDKTKRDPPASSSRPASNLYSFRDLLNGPGRRDLVIHDRTCVCVYRLISDSRPRVLLF
jgi:hypothetical protein